MPELEEKKFYGRQCKLYRGQRLLKIRAKKFRF
jgi:hypothetical protein